MALLDLYLSAAGDCECMSQWVSCLPLQIEVVQAGQFLQTDLNQSWFPHWLSTIKH